VIQFTLTGSLPKVNTDLTASMKQVAELVEASVKRNFSEGGRPTAWVALKPQVVTGNTPLMKSGALFNSIENTSDGTSATVSAGQGLPYAMTQQFGSGSNHHIPITEKSRNYFWLMYHKTGNEMWKWMAISKKTVFEGGVPARPFMMFQEEDVTKIMEIIGSGLVTFSQTNKTKE